MTDADIERFLYRLEQIALALEDQTAIAKQSLELGRDNLELSKAAAAQSRVIEQAIRRVK